MDLDSLDVVLESGRYQNHKDLIGFPDCGRLDLKYPKWAPILKKELDGPESLLQKSKTKIVFCMYLITTSTLSYGYYKKPL